MHGIRILEIPSGRVVSSGKGMFGEAAFDRFDAWLSAQIREMAPRDFLLQDGNAFCWLYLLPDGMQAPADFPLIDFPGGLYAVAADTDGATDIQALIAEVDAFLAQHQLQRDPSRPQMGHVITSPAAAALLGFEQMDYFFPIRQRQS